MPAVTPRQAIAAALALGDNRVCELIGHDDLSAMTTASHARLVAAARAAGHVID